MKKIPIDSKEKIIEKIHEEKTYLNIKYNILKIGLFGSFVRNEQKKNSDIDILVDFSILPDLFTFVEISLYLKKVFGRKVDLTTRASLRKEIESQVLSEVQYI